MKSIGTLPIETERLLLRRMLRSDAEDIYETFASDPMVTRYLSWKAHSSIAVTRAYVSSILKASRLADCYHWCIVWKETGKVVGAINVVKLDRSLETAELGYCLSKSLWNKGVMSEAVRAVMRFLFEEVGVHRIECCHHVKNLASGRVMEKCGMFIEGIKRDGAKDNEGLFCDVVCYAILRTDYLKAKAENPSNSI